MIRKLCKKFPYLNYNRTLSQVSFLWRPRNLIQRLLVERMTTLILCRATIVSKYILTSNLALQRVHFLLFFFENLWWEHAGLSISNDVSALFVQGVRKNKVDTGVSLILLLSARSLAFCLILLKMTAYVLLLFSAFLPVIRSQNIPPIEDDSDLWALVSVMSVIFTKAQINSKKLI